MTPQVAAYAFAQWTVEKVRTPAIPYVEGRRSEQGTDCINLIGWGLEELTGVSYERGSNSAWEKDFIWRGTIDEAEVQGYLVPGAIVYMDYHKPPGGSQGTRGMMDHVGVYVGFGFGLKNPEGKPADVVHASSKREGVYGSILRKNDWTHIALHRGVMYPWQAAGSASDGEPAGTPTLPEGSGTVEPGPGQAVVNTEKDPLWLRLGPGESYDTDGSLPKGTLVDVLRVMTGDAGKPWALVRWFKRGVPQKERWCAAWFLRMGGEENAEQPQEEDEVSIGTGLYTVVIPGLEADEAIQLVEYYEGAYFQDGRG